MLRGSAAQPSGDFGITLELWTVDISPLFRFYTLSPLTCRIYFTFTESQWRWGKTRIKRAPTGLGNTKWGRRPWRRHSHATPSCWTHTAAWKRCIMTNYSTIGEYWSSEAAHSPILQPLRLASQQPHTPAAASQTIIFSYMKGGWPTKDERVHKAVTGYEGAS